MTSLTNCNDYPKVVVTNPVSLPQANQCVKDYLKKEELPQCVQYWLRQLELYKRQQAALNRKPT